LLSFSVVVTNLSKVDSFMKKSIGYKVAFVFSSYQ